MSSRLILRRPGNTELSFICPFIGPSFTFLQEAWYARSQFTDC